MRLTPIKRYCGHLENVKTPESGEIFLMERGRYCRKCKNAFLSERKVLKNRCREILPRPMAMAMDNYGE